ncbi:hypothetical protein RJT34_33154 [Clitoria ternatea]|uniref:Uncharacterized protein n=1 Tax=Clitoria ternatea TaxID=43366 RepID=A0AAN9EYT0_CLITE
MASSFGKREHSLKHSTKHRTLLLKDYLRDDLSSCSSNGFKSFPRRQCCTTVGFLIEKDLETKRKRRNRLPRKRGSKSAFRRASKAVINAVKSLPLSSQTSGDKKGGLGLLSRSFSKKVLSRSFWRKVAKEGEGRRRRSFRELIMEDRERDKATSFNEDSVSGGGGPNCVTPSSSGFGSNSWGESEFTFASTTTESSNENDQVEPAPRPKIQVIIKEIWPNEKEQFSPVSILDCPFEEEEEIFKSHSNSTCSSLEGAKHTHTQKRRHFKSVASLEPVVLEKRFACLELEEEPENTSSKPYSESMPVTRRQNGNSNLCHDNNYYNMEENARNLLNFIKRSIPSNCLMMKKTENLLFDYFKQSIGENEDIDDSQKLHLCKVAEDWINGQPQEVYSGWEVQGGRYVYVREMDKCEEWKCPHQEIQQMALELENEVFTSLANELVFDLMARASH